jgi:uncharacterized protein DUF7002
MDVAELVETCPRLFHMAEPGSWAGIQRHGLLSTSALLDLFEVDGDLRVVSSAVAPLPTLGLARDSSMTWFVRATGHDPGPEIAIAGLFKREAGHERP